VAHPPSSLELRGCEVDPGYPGTALRKPRPEVRSPAPELDHALSAQLPAQLHMFLSGPLPEHAKLRVARAEHPPRDVVGGPRLTRACVRVLLVRLRPDAAVLLEGVSQTRARSHARPTRASRTRARDCRASTERGRRESFRGRRRLGSSR